MPGRSVIHNAIPSLTDPETLRRGQQIDPFLSTVRSNLLRKEIPTNDQNQRLHEYYLLDDKGSLWYAPLGRHPVLGVHQPLTPDITSLIYAMHAHPTVAATLALLRERFHWPPKARVVPEYVLSCGYWECKRETSWKMVILPDRAF